MHNLSRNLFAKRSLFFNNYERPIHLTVGPNPEHGEMGSKMQKFLKSKNFLQVINQDQNTPKSKISSRLIEFCGFESFLKCAPLAISCCLVHASENALTFGAI